MLSDYRGGSLEWEQPKALNPYLINLLAGDDTIGVYRITKPMRMVAVITTDAHQLTITPKALGLEHRITEGTTSSTPLTVIEGMRKRKNTFTVSGGLRYEWQAQGLWGLSRVFSVAGGPEVLRSEAPVMSMGAKATLTLTTAEIPERDLLLLCALAIHNVVLYRHSS